MINGTDSVQCLSQCLVVHEGSCGGDGGGGFARLEGVLLAESVDDRLEVNVLAQELSRGDEGLEVDHHPCVSTYDRTCLNSFRPERVSQGGSRSADDKACNPRPALPSRPRPQLPGRR